MNTDIRLSVGFWQHPKVFRLEKQLGLKAIRSLQILWCWCAQNRPDGNLTELDAEDIEFVADWHGKKGAFVKACEGSWLDITEDGYRLHEWKEYNPWQAQAGSREEARKEKARKAANARWQKSSADNAAGCSSNAQAYAQAMPKQCSNDATSNAQAMPTSTSTSIKTPLPPLQGGECDMHASGEAAPAEEPGKLPERDSGDEPRLVAKSGRVLAGKQLEDFERFWRDFGLSRGKAEAADAWLDIPDMTNALVARICEAARQEAADRPRLEGRGQKPKQARGWLLSRRWEDYEAPKARAPTPSDNFPTEVDRDVWEKAQVTRKRLEAEKQARRTGKAANGDET